MTHIYIGGFDTADSRSVLLQLSAWIIRSTGKTLGEYCNCSFRSLQLLGLSALGFSTGFEQLHYMFESAFDGDRLSPKFLKVHHVIVVVGSECAFFLVVLSPPFR